MLPSHTSHHSLPCNKYGNDSEMTHGHIHSGIQPSNNNTHHYLMWALTRILCRLAHVYRGALTLITTRGFPKTNEMNHDNQQANTTCERHLDFCCWLFLPLSLFPPHPLCRVPFTVTTHPVLHHATFASHHCDRPWRNDTLGASSRWVERVNPESWVDFACKEGNDFLYKPYLFLGWVVATHTLLTTHIQ